VGDDDENGHKRCVWHCLCLRYVFFLNFDLLTNNFILYLDSIYVLREKEGLGGQ
jgi:hypothetical protein